MADQQTPLTGPGKGGSQPKQPTPKPAAPPVNTPGGPPKPAAPATPAPKPTGPQWSPSKKV